MLELTLIWSHNYANKQKLTDVQFLWIYISVPNFIHFMLSLTALRWAFAMYGMVNIVASVSDFD